MRTQQKKKHKDCLKLYQATKLLGKILSHYSSESKRHTFRSLTHCQKRADKISVALIGTYWTTPNKSNTAKGLSVEIYYRNKMTTDPYC